MNWATKRKLEYFGIIVGFILLFIVLPFFVFVYEAPTCFDGKKNGGETGIDCGGSCRLLCPAEIIAPILRWDPRVFRVAPGVYSVLSYIENPNVTAEVQRAPYIFKIYDKDGILITERKGVTFIPKGRTFAIFDGNFGAGDRAPARATFSFGELIWTRSTATDPEIRITNTALMRQESAPRVEANVENESLERVSDIELTAIIFDSAGNAIAASRTFIENLEKGANDSVVFTWPQPFETTAQVCASPVDAALVIDRSGSMKSISADPPQPLTDVKNAAVYFVNQLRENDRGSLVSFATTASDPIDQILTDDFDALKRAIDAIQILPSGTQQTNIADGILKAKNELSSARSRKGVEKVMIVLTDGVATQPERKGDPKYPETFAERLAAEAQMQGIMLFTIGLGQELNTEFLAGIASSTEEFFLAPTAKDLAGIYTEIATKICTERPAVIEIILRIYPRL